MLADAPRHIKRAYTRWLEAVAALDAAPRRQKARTARVWARRLGVLPTTLWSKRSEYRKHGALALVDKRFSASCWKNRREALPPLAVQYLKNLAQDDSLNMHAVIKLFSDQLARWKKGDSTSKIPGYERPPKGNPAPGWSARNLARYLAPRKRSGRVLFEITLQFRADGTAMWFKRKASL
jgi:hypothetical protein